jgi:carbon storage regulator
MLVLSRKESQRIVIGGDIVVTIVKVAGRAVRVGVEAPPHVSIKREELLAVPGPTPALSGVAATIGSNVSLCAGLTH